MDNTKNKRSGNISLEQKRELISFIEDHPELKCGKFTSEFTFKKARCLWEQCAAALYALPGVKKDWKQWRKTWQDMKCMAKKKNSTISRHYKGTGGGLPTTVTLSEEEKMVVSLLGPALTGHPNINESDCNIKIENVEEVTDAETLVWGYNAADISIPSTSATSMPPMSTMPKTSTLELDTENNINTPSKSIRTKWLDKELLANDQLIKLTELKIKQKDEYRYQKLKLYERDVKAKEKDVEIKQKISYQLEQLLKKLN